MAYDDDRWRRGRDRDDPRERWRNEERGGRTGVYEGRDRGQDRDRGDYSRYGRDEEWEHGRFSADDYSGRGAGYGRGGYSSGGGDYEKAGFQVRSFGGGEGRRRDHDEGFGQGRGFESYGRDERQRGAHRSGAREGGGRDERGFFDRAGDEIASWFGSDDADRRRRQDAMQGDSGSQHHRGRGPRGYTRSDERIREDINDRLTDDAYVDASDIEVTVSGCEVTLNGHVDNRNARRRAEDIAESVSGVRHVQNNLRVQQSGQHGGMSGGTGAGASAMAGMSSTGTTGTGGETTRDMTAKTRT